MRTAAWRPGPGDIAADEMAVGATAVGRSAGYTGPVAGQLHVVPRPKPFAIRKSAPCKARISLGSRTRHESA